MAFPQPFLDALIDRNPIDEVVGQYVSLTRRGSNLFGLCPFHSEKTASFSVAPDKGIYYCFGCHKGGGVVNFIMADRGAGLSPTPCGSSPSARGWRYRRTRPTNRSYQQPGAAVGAVQGCGAVFPPDSCIRAAGQAGAGVLYREAGAVSKDYRHALWPWVQPRTSGAALLGHHEGKGLPSSRSFIDAGPGGHISRQERRSMYDRFRNRLMFPIIDIRGNVIGFGGRVMDDSTPKYLNSPETLIFNKRKNLFALNIARKSKQGRIILTEGYMDAIALHQYGFDCAVASLGTSLTEEHANILAKYTNQVILTYDGDEAGQNATRRAIPMLEKTGIQVRVLRMQGAKDPDEFLKKYGAQRFEVLLDSLPEPGRIPARQSQAQIRPDARRAARGISARRPPRSSPRSRTRCSARSTAAARLRPPASRPRPCSWRSKRPTASPAPSRSANAEAQELDIARQRAPKIRAIHYDNLRSATAEEGLICMLLREPELIAGVTLPAEACSVDLFGRVLTAASPAGAVRPAGLARRDGGRIHPGGDVAPVVYPEQGHISGLG